MTGWNLDLLAVGAHPDDVELTCGGTLAKSVEQGYRVGILDLTRGEMGSSGTPEIRAAESAEAARRLGVEVRTNAGLPDALLENTNEARELVVHHLRELAARTVIIPWPRGRHPDHRVASELVRDACFLAGLKNFSGGPARRPLKILYAAAFREDIGKPTFVVPISEGQFARKMEAMSCYVSQFSGATAAGEVFPTGQELMERIKVSSHHYGSLIRTLHGEPFFTEETMAVDDVASLGVPSL